MNQIKSQYDYFKVSLDLTRKYNFGNILKRSGIIPSEIKTYSFSEISDAIESELKYPPYISCYKATDNKQYIYELGICFDLDFQLIPCQSRQSSSCYKTLPIKYPTIH
jgi:ribonuclease I